MANRPVFCAQSVRPFVSVQNVEFNWNAGLAVSQKQKNIRAIHENYAQLNPEGRVLEISSKSLQPEGKLLSAFVLEKFVPSLGHSLTVEVLYQGGKVFERSGPHIDLLHGTSRDAKRDPRLTESGKLIGFEFDGVRIPTEPATMFYNYLYMNALLEHPELARKVLEYDSFTDIEFAPKRGVSCQAHAAAMFVGLHRAGMESCITDLDALARCYGG